MVRKHFFGIQQGFRLLFRFFFLRFVFVCTGLQREGNIESRNTIAQRV